MESASGIAVFAAILTVAGLFGLLSSFLRRREDEGRIGEHVKAREALTEKRLAILRRRRKRIQELGGEFRARRALSPSPEGAEASPAIPPGLDPETTEHARQLEAAKKRVKENPEEAAGVIRMLIRSEK